MARGEGGGAGCGERTCVHVAVGVGDARLAVALLVALDPRAVEEVSVGPGEAPLALFAALCKLPHVAAAVAELELSVAVALPFDKLSLVVPANGPRRHLAGREHALAVAQPVERLALVHRPIWK